MPAGKQTAYNALKSSKTCPTEGESRIKIPPLADFSENIPEGHLSALHVLSSTANKVPGGIGGHTLPMLEE
jgi:hypothetical protein